jgi:hypothetical protein
MGGCGTRVAVEVHAEWHRGMSWLGFAQEGSLWPAVLVMVLPGQTCSHARALREQISGATGWG